MNEYSVLILTLNEEHNLPRCLASVRKCDDVVVLDSGSTDRTVTLAGEADARVFSRPFDTFAGQRNHAQRHIPFRHPWVFHLDADEQMTPELAAECRAAAVRTDVDGFYVAPKMMFLNRWVPHCTDFPAWQARFVHAPEFEFIDFGHGQREAPTMRMGRLTANYLHDILAQGESAWLNKHRGYAIREARTCGQASVPLAWRRLFAADPLERRRTLKQLSYQLPFRPALRFVYQYILRRGFLDGEAGFRYCQLLARYESFVAQELRRLRLASSGE
ncbi:MAG: glycosyltransferase family 2 protein [Opitutaceae bacterium]|nr:glycosyltransferase family 2 protein [Opitutaceae bacterium]